MKICQVGRLKGLNNQEQMSKRQKKFINKDKMLTKKDSMTNGLMINLKTIYINHRKNN